MPDRLTPIRLAVGSALAVAVALLIIFFNPLTSFLRHQVGAAQAQEETAVDGQVGADQALQGQNDVNAAADRLRDTANQAEGSAHALEREAIRAPDADTPLDDAATRRLRDHDDFLCGLRPAICGEGPDGPFAGADAAR